MSCEISFGDLKPVAESVVEFFEMALRIFECTEVKEKKLIGFETLQ